MLETGQKPFRIVHVLRAPVGGLFRHVIDLARAQARRGHQVGIICAESGNALTNATLDGIAPLLALGLQRLAMRREVGLGDALALRAIKRAVDGMKPDIVHGHGAKGGAYARLAARSIAGSPKALYTPHGGSLHFAPGTLKGRVVSALEKRLEPLTAGLIFESQYAAIQYQRNIGIDPATPHRVIPNGITDDEFDGVVAHGEAAHFLFIGELRRLKGVDLLLDALARLVADGRDVHCVIVGDGPDRTAFEDQAVRLGLQARVVFKGARPARAEFSSGHVLVVPSRAESLPYIVLEAAGAGLPLIASNVGGIPEIVAGTDTPLVAPDDVGALVAALQFALDEPEAMRARAGRLKSRIQARFSVDAMATDVLAFYATLLGRSLDRLPVAAE